MASSVRELRVWQESVSLAGDTIRAIRQSARRETKIVSDSILSTALSVGSHVADGYALSSAAEQRDAYRAAKRALLRLETELAVARHADLIPPGSFTELTKRASQIAQLVTGYLVYLDRQTADAAPRANGAPNAPAVGVTLDSDRAPS